MGTRAMFPAAARRTGIYESFYLRAFSPSEPVGVWIRYTVRKAPGASPSGSLWFTLFDSRRGAPVMNKLAGAPLSVPAGAWIGVGESTIGPSGAVGSCGQDSWELAFEECEPALRHLSPRWLYRAPLPRTKLTTPAPTALLSGTVRCGDGRELTLARWPGMLGHNWGSEHAARWIWLHATGFDDDRHAWLDLALGRVMILGAMTPFIASGALSIDGRRHRLGGIGARPSVVREGAEGCEVHVRGEEGMAVAIRARVPDGSAAGWRYADPAGALHDVVNCSVAEAELEVVQGGPAGMRRLRCDHGCAYELGMREHDHGVAIAPFPDD